MFVAFDHDEACSELADRFDDGQGQKGGCRLLVRVAEHMQERFSVAHARDLPEPADSCFVRCFLAKLCPPAQSHVRGGIKPVQRADQGKKEAAGHVQRAQVRQFVEQHSSQLLTGQRGHECTRQEDARTPPSQDQGCGNPLGQHQAYRTGDVSLRFTLCQGEEQPGVGAEGDLTPATQSGAASAQSYQQVNGGPDHCDEQCP